MQLIAENLVIIGTTGEANDLGLLGQAAFAVEVV